MNWSRDLTKAQRRELRRITGLAYDRALSAALTALEEAALHAIQGGIVSATEVAPDVLEALKPGLPESR
jgi:hypothetical protein